MEQNDDANVKCNWNYIDRCRKFNAPFGGVEHERRPATITLAKNRRTLLKEELVLFGTTTSLRGIPRIIKAEGLGLKLLWSIFVAALVMGCLYNLYHIISQYLEFDVIHLPSQRYIPDATFPSFTICNQQALSENGRRLIQEKKWRTPIQYWTELRKSIEKQKLFLNNRGNKSDRNEYVLLAYAQSLMSLTGYWKNLPVGTNAADLGHTLDSLIRLCYVMTVNRTEDPPISYRNCSGTGKWRLVHDPSRLNCYTYTLDEKTRGQALYVDVMVYLNHEIESKCIECMYSDTATQIGGAQVVLHEIDTFPDVTKEGFNVMPGTLTEVKFQPIEYIKMQPPYGVCSEITPFRMTIGNDTFNYTSINCGRLRLQHRIMEKCKCVMPTLPQLPNYKIDMASSSCFHVGDINNFTYSQIRKAAKRIQCATKIEYRYVGAVNSERKMFGYLSKQCPSPCKHYTYQETVTQAEWPRKEFHEEFAKRTKLQDAIVAYNSVKTQIQQVLESNKSESVKKKEVRNLKYKLHSISIISRNFLMLKFTKKDFYVRRMEEKEVRTLASTVSQVGGLFSMWIGLTFIWIVELIDLFIRIIRIMVKSNHNASAATMFNNGEYKDTALRLYNANQCLNSANTSPIITARVNHEATSCLLLQCDNKQAIKTQSYNS